MSISDDEELMSEFLSESYENLDQLERDLVSLEKDPTNAQTIDSIFRTIHTIKGTSGFLGLNKLENIAHAGENLLSRLRDGSVQVNSGIISALLTLMDALRAILSHIKDDKNEGDTDYSTLLKTLKKHQDGKKGKASKKSASKEPPPKEPSPEPTPEPLPAVPVVEKVEKDDLPDKNTKEGSPGPIADGHIRVHVGLLDKLMNLVGELVLARNQVIQHAQAQDNTSFLQTSQRLNYITTELQEEMMKTRMQPIHHIWSKFPRVIRDIAQIFNKKVNVIMEGEETELDRTVIELIKDPLTHLVRNAVDHGIESPDVRQKIGKPAEGTLVLRAYHEGGQVNIEISDDGGGLDPHKIKTKALDKGLRSAEQLDALSDHDILDLIYLPGFSTAEKVSHVSGRGVGMDVVKTNIEKIGGTVDVQSQKDQGTTFRIKIPLTLAIIPALTVSAQNEQYAIPQISLLELVRLEGEHAKAGVETVDGVPVYRLRGQLLPLVYLNQQLVDKSEATPSASLSPSSDTVNIVVLQADERSFGLVVDDINDTQEIVVKPMGRQLMGLSCFAGATIMGDGRVALILDVLGIAQQSGVISRIRERKKKDRPVSTEDQQDNRQTLLLFKGPDQKQLALPLNSVDRLEEFPLPRIERSQDSDVIQYRDRIMPLVYLSKFFSSNDSPPPEGSIHVVVYTRGERSVGLVVDRILDITEQPLSIRRQAQGGGLLGSLVIHDKVTDLLDIEHVIRQTEPNFFDQPAETPKGSS